MLTVISRINERTTWDSWSSRNYSGWDQLFSDRRLSKAFRLWLREVWITVWVTGLTGLINGIHLCLWRKKFLVLHRKLKTHKSDLISWAGGGPQECGVFHRYVLLCVSSCAETHVSSHPWFVLCCGQSQTVSREHLRAGFQELWVSAAQAGSALTDQNRCWVHYSNLSDPGSI